MKVEGDFFPTADETGVVEEEGEDWMVVSKHRYRELCDFYEQEEEKKRRKMMAEEEKEDEQMAVVEKAEEATKNGDSDGKKKVDDEQQKVTSPNDAIHQVQMVKLISPF
jgi:hypothetical protein